MERRALAAPAEVALAGAASLGPADLDGDGDLDIAVLAEDRIAVLTNGGRGDFPAPAILEAAGDGIVGFAIGDAAGDGRTGLAAASAEALRVLVRGETGGLEPAYAFAVDGSISLRAVAIGDFDGTGGPDIVLARTQLGSAGEVQLLVSRGGGIFAPTLPLGLGPKPSSLRTIDLDGDGTEELAVLGGAAELLVLSGRGGAAALPLAIPFRTLTISTDEIEANFEPHCTILSDFDGSGSLDLATMDGEYKVMVFRNSGDGSMTDPVTYNVSGGDELIWLVAADLDRDGDFDIAATDERTDRVYVLRNGGDGRFTQTSSNATTQERPYFLAAADMNGDGIIDLVTPNWDGDSIGLYRGRGDCTFRTTWNTPLDGGPRALALGDYDRDGDVDAAVGLDDSGEVAVVPSRGDGTFDAPTLHEVPRVVYVSASDLDGDGDLDLAAAQEARDAVTLLRNDGGTFTAIAKIDVGQPPRSVIAAPLAGSSGPDLITGNEDTGTICILPSLGNGTFGLPARFPVGDAPRYTVAGDLDRDGDLDLVVANHSSFDLTFFFDERKTSGRIQVLDRIFTALDLLRVGAPVPEGPPDFQCRYIVPARQDDPTLLPARLHEAVDGRSPWGSLAALYPDRFGSLDEEGYRSLVARRSTRLYFAGRILRIPREGGVAYGFTVETDEDRDPIELPAPAEAGSVWDALEVAFALRPLAYFPESRAARDSARLWTDPGFPVLIIDPPVPFRRGDADGDGAIGMTDALDILEDLFLMTGSIPCGKSADANDDGAMDISDAVMLLFHLYGGGGDLPAPFPACDMDPTEDGVPCWEYASCNSTGS